MAVERVYDNQEIERILVARDLRSSVGDVIENVLAHNGDRRMGVIIKYHGINRIHPDMDTLSYTVTLKYTILVGHEKQHYDQSIKLSEEDLRMKV